MDLQKIVRKKEHRRKKEIIEIREPVWSTKEVGIAERLITSYNYIRITYLKADGMPMFPYLYRVSGSKLLSCPEKMVKGTKLRMIKIDDMEVYDVEGKISG
jgi:hypothetical protein